MPTTRRFVSLLLGGMLGMMSGRAAGAEPASRIVLTVVDDASLSIPGALATLSSDQLVGGARQGTTDANGVAEFSSLLPGSYRLLVQKQGFGPVTRTDIPVQYMRTSSVAIRMKPGDGSVITAEVRKTVDTAGQYCDGASDYVRWWCRDANSFLRRIPARRSYPDVVAHPDVADPDVAHPDVAHPDVAAPAQ